MLIIDYYELDKSNKIGQGAFGSVYKGKWHGVDVAVKEPHTGAELMTEQDLRDWENETSIMW